MRNGQVLAGAVALATTAAVLFAASFLAGRIPVAGFGTWFVATQIIWALGAIAMLLLPLVILRRRLAVARTRRPVALRS
ncbi:MAG: hypothetical protein FJX57_25470 [Alphaproteobacteria bacterium]|nr:hypothetical protein [Alphaproteobacteria bacterium]